MGKRILIVEDDNAIASIIQLLLESEGFACSVYSDGESAIAAYKTHCPDLIILDRQLPGDMDGLEVCTHIRQHPSSPDPYILMLSAKGEEIDKVVGLSTGADDYVVKPFGSAELVARVRALLRRRLRESQPEQTLKTKHFTLSVEQHTVTRHIDDQRSEELALASLDFKLLSTFLSRPDKAWTRNQLIEALWGDNFFGDDRVVDTQVARLRKKIEPNPSKPTFIKTVTGVGYRFEDR